jgi:hypothetical protein
MESGAQSTAPVGPANSTWQTPYNQVVQLANCSATTSNLTSFECLKQVPALTLFNITNTVKNQLVYSAA